MCWVSCPLETTPTGLPPRCSRCTQTSPTEPEPPRRSYLAHASRCEPSTPANSDAYVGIVPAELVLMVIFGNISDVDLDLSR